MSSQNPQEEEKSESLELKFSHVTWVFIILFLILNWGAIEWKDVPDIIIERKAMYLLNIVYTLPLNLSFAFALILMTSVKEYNGNHLIWSSLFFVLITVIFNSMGWLNPEITIEDHTFFVVRIFLLLKAYFVHFGLFNFIASILTALYLTYIWHFEILGKNDEEK